MATPGGSSFLNPLFQIISFGAGTAMGPVLRPTLQDLANQVWEVHPVRPLGAHDAAAMWVEGVWTPERAKQEGLYTGIGEERMTALRQLLDDPPDVTTLFALWRRGLIDGAKFIEGLRHLRIETDYFEALRRARDVLLTPATLAEARQRGFIDQARQYNEAELQGVTNDRAEIMFKSAGLPPPTERAMAMWRRGILTEAEFKATIVEGNEKLKYQDEEAALFHPLLTVHEIVNLRLRGWITTAEMNSRGAQHGYSTEQMNDLFRGQGRPISFHQVFIGLRRGGVYDGPADAIEPAFLKSLQESNIRPEWYDLAWAQRHALPNVFAIRLLTQAGDFTQVEAKDLLLETGWRDTLAEKVSTTWAGGSGQKADPLVKSATNQAITEIRSAFILGQSDETAARDWLTRLGVLAATIDALLTIWTLMREVPQKGLTAAQIVKAYRKLRDQWPRSRALDELQLLGLTADDAATLLDE